MTPQTFLFFGPSGSGKGTQAKLLKEYLEKNDPARKALHFSTGEKLREFATTDSVTAQRTKEIIDAGGLMPEFIPVWVWTNFFINNISEHEHMILDGVSRRLHEAQLMDSALRFYKKPEPKIVVIKVSHEWAIDKLVKRASIEHREDDKAEEIKKRMEWYEANVVPVIEFFKNNPYYKYIEINGEQSIEDVHEEILAKTGL